MNFLKLTIEGTFPLKILLREKILGSIDECFQLNLHLI